MATTTSLMTVEQYRKLPKCESAYLELHHGELVLVSRPKPKHYKLQNRLQDLLRERVQSPGFIGIELAFGALPEYDLRAADVAYVSKERWEAMDPDVDLRGAPELVIDVLSPSNTTAEMNDKEKLCLENSCLEFWVVDPYLRQVKVSTPDGITTTYRAGQEIPLRIIGGGTLKVDEIFA